MTDTLVASVSTAMGTYRDDALASGERADFPTMDGCSRAAIAAILDYLVGRAEQHSVEAYADCGGWGYHADVTTAVVAWLRETLGEGEP